MIEGHFWYRSAYERILDALPVDRPSRWVEVGVFQGQALVWLGGEALARGIPLQITAVDTFEGWDGTLQGVELADAFLRNTAPIAEAMGDRFVTLPVASVAAAKYFDDGSLDVVWLDADHSYEAVKADIAAWLPKIRPGGVIGGDDFAYEGVAQAVQEAFPGKFVLGDGLRHSVRWPWWMVRVGE